MPQPDGGTLKEAGGAHTAKRKENAGKRIKHLQKAIGDAVSELKTVNTTFKILSYYLYYITATLKHF